MEYLGGILAIVAVVCLACLILGLPLMLLWNWLMPMLFGMPYLTFWQAVGLNILSTILFKSTTTTTNKQ
jgi:hypothetical protein